MRLTIPYDNFTCLSQSFIACQSLNLNLIDRKNFWERNSKLGYYTTFKCKQYRLYGHRKESIRLKSTQNKKVKIFIRLGILINYDIIEWVSSILHSLVGSESWIECIDNVLYIFIV